MTNDESVEFNLKFDPAEIDTWAGQFDDPNDPVMVNEVGPRVRQVGYYTLQDLIVACHWKSARIGKKVQGNSPGYVREVTRLALSAKEERTRIEILRVLDGVDWPMASVLLHFGSQAPYPILDFRALWSVGVVRPPRYRFDFWWRYTYFCRELASRHQVSMRTLDRALWQYAKQHQRVGSKRD